MKTFKEIKESRFVDYELNLQISEKLNNVMNKYDVRYLRNLIRELNWILQQSEATILCDREVEELSHRLLFVSNNLKCEESIKKYTDVIDELSEVIDGVQNGNEFNDNVVNI